MNNNTLIEVNNLKCSYNRSDIVIEVDKLEIPTGELIVLVGASGSGKSTILEALGLMNDTIVEGNISLYIDSAEPKIYGDLWKDKNLCKDKSLWKDKDLWNDKNITDVRKRAFSFIFQNTYLMDNFSIEDNIAIAQYLQGSSKEEADSKIDKGLKEIGLDDVNKKDYHIEYSGGQQQRFSFLRAILSEYKILFADEPTGNLDQVNSSKLFEYISREIKGRDKTAIIVTHNMELAVNYADRIICITKEDNKPSKISNENIYVKKDAGIWSGLNAIDTLSNEEVNTKLEKVLSNFSSESIISKKTIPNNTKSINSRIKDNFLLLFIHRIISLFSKNQFNINFYKLFLDKESRSLFGVNNKNLKILSIILFFTVLVIGLSISGYNYLSAKMKDPFVNWVDVVIPFGGGATSNLFQIEKELKVQKDLFDIKNLNGYNRFYLTCYVNNEEEQGTNVFAGRTINLDNPILKSILSKKNHFVGRNFENRDDIGLIISRKLFERLDIKEEPAFLKTKLPLGNQEFKMINLPVIAVVDELPGNHYIISTEHFYLNRFKDPQGRHPFRVSNKQLRFFVNLPYEYNTSELQDVLNTLIAQSDSLFYLNPRISKFQKSYDTYKEGYFFKVLLNKEPSKKESAKLLNFLKHTSALKNKEMHIYEEYSLYNAGVLDCDRLSVNFSSLKHIRKFEQFMTNNYNVPINMEEVNSKENFYFISILTFGLITCIVLFSLLSISLFTSNILVNHLESIKRNLGTFKAFGVSNSSLSTIYSNIISGFVLYALVIASIGLSLVFGISAFITWFFEFDFQIKFTDFANLLILSIIAVILFCSIWYLKRIANKKLLKTPGDLIYNR